MQFIAETIAIFLDIRFWAFAWVIFIPAAWNGRLIATGAATFAYGALLTSSRADMAQRLDETAPPVALTFIHVALACAVVALVAAAVRGRKAEA